MAATEADNDTQSLLVNPTSLSVNEGGSNSFAVSLSAQPTADVTVTVARTAGDNDLTVSDGATLTFTTVDWDQDQSVAVTAIDDGYFEAMGIPRIAGGNLSWSEGTASERPARAPCRR